MIKHALQTDKAKKMKEIWVFALIGVRHKKSVYASFHQHMHLDFKPNSQENNQNMNPSHLKSAYAKI